MPEGEVTAADLEAMVADTSEEAAWALSDAIVARDPAAALGAAERLLAQGEAVTPLVYQAARRLRDANSALAQLEAGASAEAGRGGAAHAPVRGQDAGPAPAGASVGGAARRRLRGRRPRVVDAAGGSEYPDDVALTLAGRCGAGAAGRRR